MKTVNKHIEIWLPTIEEIHTGRETEWKLNVKKGHQYVRVLGLSRGAVPLGGAVPARVLPPHCWEREDWREPGGGRCATLWDRSLSAACPGSCCFPILPMESARGVGGAGERQS